MMRAKQLVGMRSVGAGFGALLCLVLAGGCAKDAGGSDREQGASGAKAAASGSGSKEATGAGGTGDFGNSMNMPTTDNTRGSMPTPGEGRVDCVGETQNAKQVQVDMYIMLDRSDSMLELTGAGPNKWDAVRSALTAFVGDSASEGLGVGLQYFPLGAPGIPESCMADGECGAQGGGCLNRACLPPRFGSAVFTPCLSTADCPLSSPGCAPFGECSLDNTLACFDLGAKGCQDMGDCNPVAGECLMYASCLVANYQNPAVEIGVLPDNGMALVDSLAAEKPIGLTPTPVALSGAINHAAEHAAANPSHRVIAVLATDGLPTQCLPQDTMTEEQAVKVVADIAAAGLKLKPAISTYVIGVFAPDDTTALQNLETIAAAGGTEHPFIVDTTQDANQQFLDALDEIRGGTLDCEFELPAAPDGKEVDYKLINVELNDASGTRSLVYVQDPTRCADSTVGWFYDADPTQGGTPTKISVCPKTCDTLHAATDASVEIRLGCPQNVM